MKRTSGVAGAALAVVLALSGCRFVWQEPELGLAVTATNETDEEVHFQVFGDDEWLDLPGTLPPGRTQPILARNDLFEPSRFTVDGCTEGDIVAFAPGGREVARHPPPVCDGDHWTITEDLGLRPSR